MPQSKRPPPSSDQEKALVSHFLVKRTTTPGAQPSVAPAASASGNSAPKKTEAKSGANAGGLAANMKRGNSILKFAKSAAELDDEKAEAEEEMTVAINKIASMAGGFRDTYTSLKRRPFPLFLCGSSNNGLEVSGIEDNLGVGYVERSDELDRDKFTTMIAYMENFLAQRIRIEAVAYEADGDEKYTPDKFKNYLNNSGDRDEIRPRLVALMLSKIYVTYPKAMAAISNEAVGNNPPVWRVALGYAVQLVNCPKLYTEKAAYVHAFVDPFKVKSAVGLNND